MNSYEEELAAYLELQNFNYAIELNARPYFAKISAGFPTFGNRIEWSKVPGHRELEASMFKSGHNSESVIHVRSEIDRAAQFWLQCIRLANVSEKEEVVVIGDNAIEFAIRISIAGMVPHAVHQGVISTDYAPDL